MSGPTSNESFTLSLIRFFRTYVRETVRPYGRTDVPKKNRDVPTNKSCSSPKISGKKCRSRCCPTPPCRARAVRTVRGPPKSAVKKISRTYKRKLSEMTSNESFVFSLIRFFCTYGRTYVPPYVRTDVPKQIRDIPTNESCPSRKVDGRK